MINKTMNIFYGEDCLPYKDKEREVHYPIVGSAFQGASQTTTINFYVDQIGGSELVWIAIGKLPNGKIGSKLLTSHSDSTLGETYVDLQLGAFFTQAKGDLYISLQGYAGGTNIIYDSEDEIYKIEGEPVVQATGSVKIAINYSTQLVGSGEEEQLTIQEALGLYYTKLDKNSPKYIKVVDELANINSESYKDYLQVGDIFYCGGENSFYSIDEGEYPYLTYSEMEFEFAYLIVGELDARDIDATGSIRVDDFSSIKNRSNVTLTTYVENQIDNAITTFSNTYVDTFAKSLTMSLDSSTYVLTTTLEDNNGNTLSSISIDLPLETMVVSGTYDSENEQIVLELKNGEYIYIPVGDLVSGLVSTSDLASELTNYVPKTTTISGIALSSNISSQTLVDSLVYATTSDIESIMED